MRRATFLGCVLLLSACRTTSALQWASPQELQAPAADVFPEAPAVALLRSEHLFLFVDGNGQATSRQLEHRVIYIRSEEGKTFGEVRITVPPSYQLVELKARVLQPDGTLVEIPSDRFVAQSSESEKQGIGARVFHFPDVRVGSTLEYSYLLETPTLVANEWLRSTANLPTLKYDAAVTFNLPILFQASVYNSERPYQVSIDDDFTRTFHWTVTNLPAHQEEAYAPYWSLSEPWALFRVTKLSFRGRYFDWLATWTSAMQWWDKQVDVDTKLYEGFQPRPLGTCESKRCLIDRALADVRETTDWDGVGEFDTMRPLRQVIEGGQKPRASKERCCCGGF